MTEQEARRLAQEIRKVWIDGGGPLEEKAYAVLMRPPEPPSPYGVPRRWIVDLLSSPYPETEGVDGHLKGIGIRGVRELPRVDDALVDKLVGIARAGQRAAPDQRVDESRRFGMRAALKELGIE